MAVWIILITLELAVLFLLSRRMTKNLFTAVFLLTKSRPVAIGFLSFLFFPGTVIHELAHMFTAEILGVRTGGLTLTPDITNDTHGSKDVRTGSVMISQSDPIRRAAIGVAPVFVGLGILGILTYFLPTLWNQVSLAAQTGELLNDPALYGLLATLYGLFTVSHTMFSSKEDMEGFWPVVLVLSLLVGAGYIAGLRLTLSDTATDTLTSFLASGATNLGFISAINIMLLFGSTLFIRFAERITQRKLAQ